jgi:hypothetical protein
MCSPPTFLRRALAMCRRIPAAATRFHRTRPLPEPAWAMGAAVSHLPQASNSLRWCLLSCPPIQLLMLAPQPETQSSIFKVAHCQLHGNVTASANILWLAGL